MSVPGRIAQGLAGIRPRRPPALPADLQALLPDAAVDAFSSLPAYDQHHLIAVTRCVQRTGSSDPDLLCAALLHDIGKGALGGRVRFADRIAYVLVQSMAPGLTARLARLPAPRWRRGFALAHHHPALGAAWVIDLGFGERTAWLIDHHSDAMPPYDPDLGTLIACDRATKAG